MSITVNGTTGLNFPDGTSQPTAGFVPFRNKIINGDMQIDQRNAGATATITTDPQYTVDRWKVGAITGSRVSVARSTAAPAGFTNSVLITSLAATSVGANDYYGIQQDIEGFNVSDLAWGTASASAITVSFWIRSSLTGTFAFAIRNQDQNRSYPTTYTISQANAWEYKTVTIPGDTTGTWGTGNGVGIRLTFSLGNGTNFQSTANAWAASNRIATPGSVALVSTNGATMNITGVQVEKGTAATAFEFLPAQVELAMCQRYFEKSYPIDRVPGSVTGTTLLTGIQAASQYAAIYAPFKVEKRAAPTAIVYNPSTGTAGQMIADATNITNPSVGVNVFGIYSHCNGQTTSINQFLNMHFAVSAEL
jgi:hypothetical protein